MLTNEVFGDETLGVFRVIGMEVNSHDGSCRHHWYSPFTAEFTQPRGGVSVA